MKSLKIIVMVVSLLFALTYSYAEGGSGFFYPYSSSEKSSRKFYLDFLEKKNSEIEKIFPDEYESAKSFVYLSLEIAYNFAIVILFLIQYGYEPDYHTILYRSEGYTSFPDQEYYIKKYGILSKRLAAKILDIEPSQLSNDCNLNYERMGEFYRQAYLKIDSDPDLLYLSYFELFSELKNLIIQNPNSDPIKDLCELHTGWCKWESYLISTGDLKTAYKYSGKTYKFTPISISSMSFDTNIYCGETKNAVILWISPWYYNIERVR